MGRKNQRPELFDLLNGKIENGQNVRVFLFQTGQMYGVIEQEQIDSIYLFLSWKVFLRDGMIWSHSPYVYQEENEEIEELFVLEQ
jgi:sulfate adenylyltransferase subunit 2